MNVLEKKPDSGRRELAERECRRYDDLKATRDQVFMSAWQTLSQYFLPNLSDINETKSEDSTGWMSRVYDTTAIEDARVCTTGQANWATPSAEPWFHWAPPENLNQGDDDEGAIWCGICTDIALKELARSNYYRVSGAQYKNRTVFGTGHLHIEEGKDSLINCRARKIGTYAVAENSDGVIDTVYAEFKFTARQAEQEFGLANLSPAIRKVLEKDEGRAKDKEFTFLHAIRPRERSERAQGQIDAANKPIASIYIAKDEKFCVRVGGYDEMPDSVTRFDEWGSGSPWGYSPAFECLPNVRQINYVVQFMDAQVELRANPRVLYPTNLVGQVDMRPGGMTPFDPNMPNAVPKEWMTQADVATTEESVDKKRAAVHRMFYTDVFKALSQMQQTYKRPPTAYEIQKILGENLEQLSPMFGRLITEKCGPDLRRIFGILFRAGKFPAPPRSMLVPSADGRTASLAMPEITYTSRLALALKALQNRGTMDTFEFLTNVAGNLQRPDVLDSFDLDGAARAFAINQGMPPRYIRPMKEVLKLREARAAAAQQQQQVAMAEQAASAAGKLGSAPQPIQNAVSDQFAGAAA